MTERDLMRPVKKSNTFALLPNRFKSAAMSTKILLYPLKEVKKATGELKHFGLFVSLY